MAKTRHRACWLILLLTALGPGAAHAGTASAEGVGYQAFNLPFTEILQRLPELARRGYTHIQVSPVQKSISVNQWWALYQPLDFSLIEGPLGGEAEFESLTRSAHRHGLKIIVDVVLNHMANLEHAPGYHYAQFSARDFHFPDSRPCIQNWSDRFEVTHHWLCFSTPKNRKPSLGADAGGLPDLDTSSSHVRSVHRRFLEKLLALGADGFRLDAAKHIEPEYFRAVLDGLVLRQEGNRAPRRPWIYGEVIGSSSAEYGEYLPLMDVTDFRLLDTMLGIFNSQNGDLRRLPQAEKSGHALPGESAVVFARNHDTAMGRDFHRFSDARDVPLAMAFLFARGRGLPFVYREDAELPMVQAGVSFYRRFQGVPMTALNGKALCPECDDPALLFMARLPRSAPGGLVIINRADRWFEPAQLRTPGLVPGCYRELAFGFTIQVSTMPEGGTQITSWGGQRKIRIGAKTALYVVPVAPAVNGSCARIR